MKIGIRKPSVKKRIAARASLKRMIRSKVRAPKGFGWLTNPRKAAYNRIYHRTTKKACYIATAVYGDPGAWQVKRLRSYRDNVLMSHLLGVIFIRLYYEVSPHLIVIFKNIRPLNSIVRKLLDAFVCKIPASDSSRDNRLPSGERLRPPTVWKGHLSQLNQRIGQLSLKPGEEEAKKKGWWQFWQRD